MIGEDFSRIPARYLSLSAGCRTLYHHPPDRNAERDEPIDTGPSVNHRDEVRIGENAQARSLQHTIRPGQFLVLGFGSIVGTGWVVLLGGWLAHAGPGGAVVGILLGGVSMMLIAGMYAELASRLPLTGGEVTYVNAIFGKQFGFIVGWLLTLAYVSNLIFEGVAVAWLLEILWPPITGPVLYVVLGQSIGLGSLLASLASCVTITVLNYRGARSFVRFQNGLTALFLLIVLATVGFELHFGSGQNYKPLWQAADGSSWLVGAAWVFGCAPFMFNSFQSVLQAIEERSPSTSKEVVVRLCILAVAGAALFYILIVVAATMSTPWVALASRDLPAVAALAHLPGSRALTTALLVALIASVLKTWSSVFMATVRMVYAQSRDGMIPRYFGSVNPTTGAPGRAVIGVGILNLAGLFFGKGLIEPIVNTTSLCVAVIFVLICAGALTLRRRVPNHVGFRVPGGTPVAILSIALASAMAVFAMLHPAQSSGATAFKWVLLAAWALCGLGLYQARNRAARV
jgi:APA family basic amino acid/polyamine antiporter